MNIIENASTILRIAQNIYELITKLNNKVIFDNISLRVDNSICYFESPYIDGVIIKKENDYQIKASVLYADNQVFGKINIYQNQDKIILQGLKNYSWDYPDTYDLDLLNESEISLVISKVLDILNNLYHEIINTTHQTRKLIK